MREVPAAFQEHLSGEVTTVAELLRLTLDDGRIFGITSLDRDIEFQGLMYRSINGLNSKVIATDAKMSVSNSEFSTLLRALVLDGLTEKQIQNGALDKGLWDFYIINYRDTSQFLLIDSGDVGDVQVKDKADVTIGITSVSMRLLQLVGTKWSRRCRATFGTYANSQTGCGVDASGMWKDGIVTGVSGEDVRLFTTDSPLDYIPKTARIVFTSGDNEGSRLYQVDSYDNTSGIVLLFEQTKKPIKVGDTFKMRTDCDKTPSQCKDIFNNYINYKGEPWIPLNGQSAIVPLDI